MEVWGALLIIFVCPLIGGMPVIAWITRAFTGRNLARLGTGNIGVQAAFYHGGKLVGILAVISEASKGIAAVLIARAFFPTGSPWELIALIALVMGRYWMGRGAGTTNVVWGYVVHDWRVAVLVFVIGGISFTLLRDRTSGRIGVLVLVPLIVALLHPHESARIVAAATLSFLIGWIYKKMPDDLNLSPEQATSSESQAMFRFFRGDKALLTLDQPLEVRKVGQKAATLSQLKRWGYPVPPGWVLSPGDDPATLIEYLQPSDASVLVVRSSAIGEDSEQASAAGQYQSILNVKSESQLQEAINYCLASYDTANAIQYRRDRNIPEDANATASCGSTLAVLIQKQVNGVFSGVAFSRDPISRVGDAVVIEALPGDATQVVSGLVTPEQYQVFVPEVDCQSSWVMPEDLQLELEGAGDVPPGLIRQVAYLARHLEARFHGIPQDIEWSYDGQMLWLLQARPITTLIPIWTRKIAAEVIPGLIRPLTWSINRPLTCGVWGEIFTIVLGNSSKGLDFNETATLHYSRAYFNATLLGQIFRRMGLPPESLEFLTRGAKFSKPPIASTLRNVPGLMRLLGREISLEKDFKQDYKRIFSPILNGFETIPVSTLSPSELLQRVDTILEVLKRATYYSILAPLSAALRPAIFKVKETELDNSQMPEVASMRELQQLANDAYNLVPNKEQLKSQATPFLFTLLGEIPEGQRILQQFNQWLNRYGYLSEVGTDIAVPRWKEDPHPAREIFGQFFGENEPPQRSEAHQRVRRRERQGKAGGKVNLVQARLNLKGKVTEVYSQFLAQLRWSFVALEKLWLDSGMLTESGDIFFLELSEIRRLVASDNLLIRDVKELILQRRSQLEQDKQIEAAPYLIYGNSPVISIKSKIQNPKSKIQGIGASPGVVEGRVKVLRNLQAIPDLESNTILVVPYTDSGWAPLLARAGGLIAEVGGRLSHGAIVAREYGIPAVMDIHNATQIFQDGQRVRIDGQLGIVEII